MPKLPVLGNNKFKSMIYLVISLVFYVTLAMPKLLALGNKNKKLIFSSLFHSFFVTL